MSPPNDVSYYFKHYIILLYQEQLKTSRRLQSNANVDVIVVGLNTLVVKCMKLILCRPNYLITGKMPAKRAAHIGKWKNGYIEWKASDERHGHCPNYMQRRVTILFCNNITQKADSTIFDAGSSCEVALVALHLLHLMSLCVVSSLKNSICRVPPMPS